jgi:type I restriction-modification system DNA methylase subunit
MFKNKNSKKNYSTEIEKLQNGVRILEESKLDILEKNIDIKKVDRKIKKYKKRIRKLEKQTV